MRENNTLPPGLVPLFTCDVDAPVTLYEGEGVLTVGGEANRGHCVIRFAWIPNVGPLVRFRGLKRPIELEAEATLHVASIGLSAPVSSLRTSWGLNPEFEGFFDRPVDLGNEAAMARVLFHVPNFHAVIGKPIQRDGGAHSGRITLASPPWAVTIDPVPDLHARGSLNLAERLAQQRGSAITHVGELYRSDGADFSAPEANDVLNDVGRTLSLARATFCFPLLRVGFDGAGARVWESWRPFRATACRTFENWFSTRDPGILQSVFAGWREAPVPTREVLEAALNLYIDAHAPALAVESRLVLMQAALEGLAQNWPHPPLPGRAPLTVGGKAAVRISRVEASLGLSALPQLAHLNALPLPAHDSSLLEKMIWIRNSIAHLHQVPRLSAHPRMLRFEAKQFAALHLELALLRMLNADGHYVNRVTAKARWERERLPWLPKLP